MSSLLDRINAAVDGLCPCGAPPADGSAYCSDDCRPTHIAADTDTRMSGDLSTPMRWRPDLVAAAADPDLIPVDAVRAAETVAIAEGRHNAHVYQRASDPTVWHLRLDDGHRYVGCDLAHMGALEGVVSIEQTARIHDAWQRLERELVNPRHTELVDDGPWADVGWGTSDFGQVWALPPNHTPHVHFDTPSCAGRVFIAPVGTDPSDVDRWTDVGCIVADGLTDHSPQQVDPTGFDVDSTYTRFIPCVNARAAQMFRIAGMQEGQDFLVYNTEPPVSEADSAETNRQDPRQRALAARRNRNTGPPPDRLDGRRRRR